MSYSPSIVCSHLSSVSSIYIPPEAKARSRRIKSHNFAYLNKSHSKWDFPPIARCTRSGCRTNDVAIDRDVKGKTEADVPVVAAGATACTGVPPAPLEYTEEGDHAGQRRRSKNSPSILLLSVFSILREMEGNEIEATRLHKNIGSSEWSTNTVYWTIANMRGAGGIGWSGGATQRQTETMGGKANHLPTTYASSESNTTSKTPGNWRETVEVLGNLIMKGKDQPEDEYMRREQSSLSSG
ncbi:hypothetical protein C8R45DRAFT_942001 [Mycena sanguinolenta]|nr:hypothetical protein C8R45DRAFT_942001 [Mycena sanguinolenta]